VSSQSSSECTHFAIRICAGGLQVSRTFESFRRVLATPVATTLLRTWTTEAPRSRVRGFHVPQASLRVAGETMTQRLGTVSGRLSDVGVVRDCEGRGFGQGA